MVFTGVKNLTLMACLLVHPCSSTPYLGPLEVVTRMETGILFLFIFETKNEWGGRNPG